MRPFSEVKAQFTIFDAWRDLGLPGEPGRSCRCPWREDAKPSFSVFNDGRKFKDHATDEGGDVGDFVSKVTGWSVKDALEWCRERVGIDFEHDWVSPLSKPKSARAELKLPVTTSGGAREWEAVANLRGIQPYAAEVASKLGVLTFGQVCAHSCWILHAPGKIAEARRMDGKPFPSLSTLGERKAHTLAGSRKDWPLGANILMGEIPAHVLLVEGGPDWLAALHFIIVHKRKDMLPVAMLGRTNRIGHDALPLFRGRRVRIFPHDDPDGGGLEAAKRWGAQLRGVGCEVDAFSFDGILRKDGLPAKDLNDAAQCRPEDEAKLESLLP